MSDLTYNQEVREKPLVWLHGKIKTPPFSAPARLKAGFLLRLLQQGETLAMPNSRPMPSVGPNCHELRVSDENVQWRIFYYTAQDAIVILAIVKKKTGATTKKVLDTARQRLRIYKNITETQQNADL